MALKRWHEEPSADTKKKKRVGFANIDSGIEANECIKIFIVNCEEEVGLESNISVDPVDINPFFGEEGKIYGYKGLKINVWVSSVSFLAYANITFESTSDGGKGITDLKPALQKIFGETLVEKKEFLQSFSTECQYIRNVVSDGVVISCNAIGGNDSHFDGGKHMDDAGSTIEVIRMNLNNMTVGVLYSRLVPLVLLLIEGSRPIDITDPRWEIYFVIKKAPDQLGVKSFELLGFMTVYRFYHYSDSSRLRISQILVLPPYQGHSYGRLLLESVNSVAGSENVYDVTVEEPSDYLQHVRACMDTLRLLACEPTRAAVSSVASYLKEGNFSKRTSKFQLGPPARLIEDVRDKLKINKKQLLRCWEVLVYLNLDAENSRWVENFRDCLSHRVKDDILDKDVGNDGKQLIEVPNDYNREMSFVVFRSKDTRDLERLPGNGGQDETSQEQQLGQLVDERMEEIAEIAKKVAMLQNP